MHRASCDEPLEVPLDVPADVLGCGVEVHPVGRSDSVTSALFACALSDAVAAAPADPERAPAVRPPIANPMPTRLTTLTAKTF
jgi:hypothetical protein